MYRSTHLMWNAGRSGSNHHPRYVRDDCAKNQLGDPPEKHTEKLDDCGVIRTQSTSVARSQTTFGKSSTGSAKKLSKKLSQALAMFEQDVITPLTSGGNNLPGACKSKGSSRACSARIAQLVEQRIENPRVGGSNPPSGTIFLKSCKIGVVSFRALNACRVKSYCAGGTKQVNQQKTPQVDRQCRPDSSDSSQTLAAVGVLFGAVAVEGGAA